MHFVTFEDDALHFIALNDIFFWLTSVHTRLLPDTVHTCPWALKPTGGMRFSGQLVASAGHSSGASTNIENEIEVR